MPSVHVRRRSTYSSLGDTDAPSRPTRGRNTASASSRPRADDPATTTSFLNSSNPSGSPRFSSVVYRAARHNSLSHRSHAVSPLSEQGVPHSRTRSYTTGTRPAARDLFGSPSASPNIDLYPSLTRRAPTADVENQQHAQHSYPPEPESEGETDDLMHDDAVVDHLDVIDPGVATVGVLANTANAIIFPPVSIYSRKPVVSLPSAPGTVSGRPASIAAPEEQIDAHVDEILSKRAKFKRILHGVWAFLKTPMGILVGIYGFLVAFWGAAIVLFLLKWINVHNEETQAEWVEISCQIENTLFCITGLGLAPWRILDTYRIAKIWWYKIRTEKLRKKANLPALYDEDDLPDPQYDPNYVHVLSEKEQADLHYQQVKFMHSQTWYRPHGTATHKAFPIDYALAICSLNVGNSIFQAMLAGCMWSMDRFNRPAWTTGSLIPFAFLCGIFSGVLIWRGGQLAKRTAAVEECLREALAARAAGLKDGLAASEGEGEGEGEGDEGEKLVGAGDTPLLPTVFEGSDIRPGPSS